MKAGRILMLAFVSVAVILLTGAVAEERGTKDEAKAIVDAAVEHAKKVGAEQAFKDWSTDKARWTKKDLYIVAIDFNGIVRAHGVNPKLIGADHLEIKDANGVMFTAEMIKVARTKGEGWVTYLWPHPLTKKMATKSTYVRKVPSYEAWVGVGIYP